MKNVLLTVTTILICVISTGNLYAQYSGTFTGKVFSNDAAGAQTDDYLNINPKSAAGATSYWSIGHKDGGPIFAAFFANPNPYISIGYGRSTNLHVNGNVGIGTLTPQAKLHVMGDMMTQNSFGWVKIYTGNAIFAYYITDRAAHYFDKEVHSGAGTFKATSTDLQLWAGPTQGLTVLQANGNVGVGINNPETKLHVSGGSMSLDGATPTVYTGTGSTELNRYLTIKNTPASPTSSGMKVGGMLVSDTYTYANPAKNDLVVKGNVSIGTPAVGTYMLAVNGKIGAKEVRVEKTSSAWPDYVFATTYRLPSLSEVERYIQEHHHLREVPSAAQVEKDGHDLGEMDAILLKKIEELTLYIIEQQKQIEKQQKQLDALINQIR